MEAAWLVFKRLILIIVPKNMISESVNQWSTIDRGSTSCTSKGAGQKFNIQKGKKKKNTNYFNIND